MPTPLADLDVLPSATMNHGIVSDEKVDPLVSRTATGSLTKESLEGDVEGVEYPTDEEKATLPRMAGKIPWAAYTIAAVEFVERFSYYGSTVVFTNFVQQALPPNSPTGAGGLVGQSGALGLGQMASTAIGTLNQFLVYCTPILGAVIADQYLGRYRTICYAVAITIVGHVLLTISAIPSVLANVNGALGCFIIAILVNALGTGVIKSNIAPLIAEQARGSGRMIIRVLPNGQRVIEDPALTVTRIFSFFYLLINIGALVGQIGMTYAEKFVGFYLAFLLPTLMMCLCPFVLWYGNSRYVKTPPSGSTISKAFMLFRLAARGRWTSLSAMRSSDFWDSVKPSTIPASERPKWMTFDDEWVDEVKRGISACKVFLWYPCYWLCYSQINNNLTSQAATMRLDNLPNDVISNLDPLGLILFIPIFDLVVYPLLSRNGIRFTPIKKITLGFATGTGAMICAAIVQNAIYQQSTCGQFAGECDTTVGISVWAQTPSYVLIAISEILASITGLEYAYTKAPTSMRSLVMSIFLFQTAISSALGFAFVPLSADPLLVWNYGSVAILSGLATIGFYFSFRHLDSQEDVLNELPVGKVTATYSKKELAEE